MRVLELGEYVSAPYCGKTLALWGAEVIKVEFPDGDPARRMGPFKDGMPHPETSALYLYLNGGKKSITLNPLVSTGSRLLNQLAGQCDIVVCNLERSIVERLDLCGYAKCHPEKVVVSLTPFGLTGPYSHFESTVGVALALGGYMFLMGDQGREPLAMPGWYPEYQAGAQGVVAALAAWLGRSTHPVGSVLEISTMEVLCSLHQWTTVHYSYTGAVRSRHGNRFERTHPIALLPCKDGWVGMSITTPMFWESFCKMVGHPEMITDPRFQSRWERAMHADDIDEVIIPWLMERTAAEIFKESQEVYRLPIGPALRFPELLTDRHLRARGFWQEIDHPVAGQLSYPSSPFRLKELPPPEKPAPLLGQHNEEIYGSLLGLSKEEQARLRQMGVI